MLETARKGKAMSNSVTPAVERIARVLAGLKLSSNAEGGEEHAATSVEMEWQDEIEAALAVLRTLRQPDPDMAKVGDEHVWRRMVAAAIGQPAI
jgi:hypothetical protein